MTAKTKIDFFVPGFSKCGTTSLFEILNSHPDIFIPLAKEPNYFGFPKPGNRSEWFDSLYSPARHDQMKGDCSTFYSAASAEKSASEEIWKNNPNAKFIFIARDPIRRIESSFREMHNSAPKYGLNTPFQLGQAFVELPQILEDTAFHSRILNYKKCFGDDNVLLILMEDLKSNTESVAMRCYEFLGLKGYSYSGQALPFMNKGEEKLYDSSLFRWIRCNPFLGTLLSKVSINDQDRIASRIGLRKRFVNPVVWDDLAIALVTEKIVPEIEDFIQAEGVDRHCWKSYSEFFQKVRM